jgi:hypothetical protein
MDEREEHDIVVRRLLADVFCDETLSAQSRRSSSARITSA